MTQHTTKTYSVKGQPTDTPGLIPLLTLNTTPSSFYGKPSLDHDTITSGKTNPVQITNTHRTTIYIPAP